MDPIVAIFEMITFLGDALFILISLPFIFLYRKKFGLRLALTVLFSIYLCNLLKIIFRIPRPPQSQWKVSASGYSFPSGHATDSSSFWGYMGLEGYRSKNNLVYPTISTIIFILVGYSRVYLGVHTWYDVIGGWFLGLFMAYITYEFGDKFAGYFGNLEWYAKIAYASIGYAILLGIAFPFSYGSTAAQASFLDVVESLSAVYGIYIGLTVGKKFYEKWKDGKGLISFIVRGVIGFVIVAIPYFITKIFQGIYFVAIALFLVGFLLTAVVPPIINKLPKGL